MNRGTSRRRALLDSPRSALMPCYRQIIFEAMCATVCRNGTHYDARRDVVVDTPRDDAASNGRCRMTTSPPTALIAASIRRQRYR